MDQDVETIDDILDKIAHAATAKANRPKKNVGVYPAIVIDSKDFSNVKTFGYQEQNYASRPKMFTKGKVALYSAAILLCAAIGYFSANYSKFLPKQNISAIESISLSNDSACAQNYFNGFSDEKKRELISKAKQQGINTREELKQFYLNSRNGQ